MTVWIYDEHNLYKSGTCHVQVYVDAHANPEIIFFVNTFVYEIINFIINKSLTENKIQMQNSALLSHIIKIAEKFVYEFSFRFVHFEAFKFKFKPS